MNPKTRVIRALFGCYGCVHHGKQCAGLKRFHTCSLDGYHQIYIPINRLIPWRKYREPKKEGEN